MILIISGSSLFHLLPNSVIITSIMTQYIENIQAIWLAFGCLFTLLWCQKNTYR